MHSFKMKISRTMIESLSQLINGIVVLPTTNNDERLLIATLAQIGAMLNDKIGMYKPNNPMYTIKLNTAQMFAIIILSNDYVPDVTSYTGNFLQTQSLKIQQQTA